MKNTANFVGKKAYIGIDVHRKSFAVVIYVEGKFISTFRSPPCGESVLKAVKRKVPGAEIQVCYEIGFSGFHLARWFKEQGVDCVVVDPGSIEVSVKDRVKTDRKDAKNLAQQLAQGRLNSIFVPSEDQETERLPHRTRQQFVDKRKQTMNQIRSRLHQFGLMPVEHDGVLTLRVVRESLEGAPPRLKAAVEYFVSLWELLNATIRDLEKQIKEESGAEEELLKSIPGIGPIIAKTIVAEIADIHRFKSGIRLVSYVGLNPSEHSSGDSVKRGGITHQGNSCLRALLVQAAWTIVGKDDYFKSFYKKLCIRKKKCVAIVAVARKMLLMLRKMLLTGSLYECQAVT